MPELRLYGRIYCHWSTLTQPACWSWRPPDDADVERARFDRHSPDGGYEYGSWDHGLRLLLNFSRGRCAICGSANPDGPTLHMDHDHETWLCRGVLCHHCNLDEGYDRSAPVFGSYRRRSPAAITGVRLPWQAGLGPWPSPELVDLWWSLPYRERKDRGWRPREGRHWLKPELAFAQRDDLTDEQIAGALGRALSAVQRKRRELGATYWTPKESAA